MVLLHVLKVDGRLVNDSKGKADVLNQHFQLVFTRTSVTSVNMTSPFPSVPKVTVPGVLKLLKGLNPNKACGPDNIGPRLLRELSEQIASPLTTIFQQSLHDGIVPGYWRKANITPVFKKGQKYQCCNYRPISLTCIVSKLIEHVVCSSSLAYHIPPSSCDYHLYSFSLALFVTGTLFLKRSSGPLPWYSRV